MITIAEWCLAGAVMLYLLTIAPAKALGHREFDNGSPRSESFYKHPVRQRALGAHINGIEAFPFFAAAVLLAEFKHAPQAPIDLMAAAFLIARLLFVLAYVGDRPTLRTIFWNIAFAFNLGIFFLPGAGSQGSALIVVAAIGWSLAVGALLLVLERRKRRTAA